MTDHSSSVLNGSWTIYVCPECGRWYGDVVYDGHDGGWRCVGRPPVVHAAAVMLPVPVVPRSTDNDSEHRAVTMTRVLALLRQAEHRMVHGGCNVPGYTGGHTVFFPDDVWPDLLEIVEEAQRA